MPSEAGHFKFSKKRREVSDVSESLTVMTFTLKMLFLISLDTHPYRNDLPEPLGKNSHEADPVGHKAIETPYTIFH